MSTRVNSPGMTGAAMYTESAGTSKRNRLVVVCAAFRPVRISADVVSNAAVPGRPGVSLNGNASLKKSQMLMLIACGAPSRIASEMLSQYDPPVGDKLQQRVTFNLQDVSSDFLLETTLKPLGLKHRVTADTLEIVPAP